MGASPVQAHDTIVSVTPEDGGQVEVAPEQAVLTFSGQLTDVAPQAVVQQGDTVIEADAVSIDGYDLIVPLPKLEAGDYSILYSVVSSDGHRIEGQTTFTVTVGVEPESGPTSEESSEATATEPEVATTGPEEITTEPAETTSNSDEAEDSDASADDSDNSALASVFRWGGLIIVVLGAGLIIYRTINKRRN